MPTIRIPDFEALAKDLAFSGKPVERSDFEATSEAARIHSSADVGRIVVALRQAYAAGWNDREDVGNK
jgi:hypothetical protein